MLSPVRNLPYLAINNLQVSNNATTPTTKIDVAAGNCRDSTNTIDIELSAAVTIDATTNGANGLDTGDLANTTWYAVHIIGSSTNAAEPAALVSTSATAPTLPAGYDAFRRIGWLKTDGSAEFLSVFIDGNGNLREYFWNVEKETTLVIDEESGTTPTTYTAASCATVVPPTARALTLRVDFKPATAANKAYLRPTGSSVTELFAVIGPVLDESVYDYVPMNCNASQSIDYHATAAADALVAFVVSFKDYI